MTERDLKIRFPEEGKGRRKAAGKLYRVLAFKIDSMFESSRETTIALERLEESLMWLLKQLDD